MGTITKALSLLDLFSEARPEMGLTDFKKLSGQDKATVHRYLGELEQTGYLEQDAATRSYRLGPSLLRLSALREATFPTRQVIAPVVDRMAAELGELVHVSLLQGIAMSPVHACDVPVHGTRVFFDGAEVLPMHATASGIAVLAFGPPGLMDRVLAQPLKRYTPRTPAGPAALEAAVDAARREGHAFADQTFDPEVCSLAMPIHDRRGLATAAISVAVPASRLDSAKRGAILAALRDAAATLTERLGGTDPGALRHAG